MNRLRAAHDFLASRGSWRRADGFVMLALALAVLLRWPDRARSLLTWDAHTFAIALTDYNVNGLHPHAPGYPVYVALGRLAHAVWPDANAALIVLSITACAVGVALTYAVASRFAARGVALAAAALLAATPLLHVHAMTANSYAADLAFSCLVAAAAHWCARDPQPRRVAVLAAVFGVAVGVRQSLALFLGPLVAWAALRPPWTWATQRRRLLPAAGVGLAVGLAWFLPMTAASGGVATWRRANALQSDVVFEHPVWQDPWMLQVNADRMALYLQWELQWIVWPLLVVTALAFLAGRWAPPLRAAMGAAMTRFDAAFLALWGVPALLFYLTVYSGYGNGPSGYALILLPPLLVSAALLVAWALRALPWSQVRPVGAGLALAVALTGLLGHLHEVPDADYHEHDGWVAAWSGLPAGFPPSNSSIVTAYNFAHVWYAYPDYHAYEYRPPGKAVGEVPDFLLIQHAYQGKATPDWYDEIADRVTAGPHPLQPGIENLVLFDFQLAGENGGERQVLPEIPVHEAILPNGWRILYVHVTPDRPLLEDYFTMDGRLP